MTQDEIMQLAIQAGASPDENKIWLMYAEEIEAFANLVAAKEREALAQPEQEPVAWMRQDGQKVTTASDRHNYPDYETRYSIPLYTTPPQRSESSGKPSAWVGLTDKQTTQAIKSMPKGIKGWMIDWDLHDFSKAIEAKLKEKNI
jgi:hypothetical protein